MPSQASSAAPSRTRSALVYFFYKVLLFFAYWFGASRFDVDGDGDFDPEDVQKFLEDKGVIRRNFKRMDKSKQKSAGPSARKRDESVGRSPGEEPGGGAGMSLDRNRDGQVGMDDLMESTVQGQSVEEYMRKEQQYPIFICLQTTVALGFWIIGAIVESGNSDVDFYHLKAGLDTISPGWSDLRLFGPECQDWRGEVWRNLTYQFTHVGAAHILMNCLMNTILGVPLEGLHGKLRMFALYNLGVFGGAVCYWVGDGHKHVVGMSGGCYALIGVHISGLLLNWHQMKFRKPIAALLAALIIIDVISYVLALGEASASHTAHVGGAMMGLSAGVLIGKNLVVKRHERILQIFFLGCASVWLLFCLIWMLAHNPPRNLQEARGWCWVRQVWSQSRFITRDWVCVKCGTKACIDDFSQEEHISTVRLSACQSFVFGS